MPARILYTLTVGEDTPPILATWPEIVAANEPEIVQEIAEALAEYGQYVGGGGAAPEQRITPFCPR